MTSQLVVDDFLGYPELFVRVPIHYELYAAATFNHGARW